MQPVKRQLEAALAEIEGSSKNGGYDAMRRYLQLVCKSLAAPRCSLVLAKTISVHDQLMSNPQVRELKVRESENVALLGSKLLRQHTSKLSVEERESSPSSTPTCKSGIFMHASQGIICMTTLSREACLRQLTYTTCSIGLAPCLR